MTYTIKGYELVIGCEIHAQVASKSKLFSRAATEFGAAQNSQVSLVDVAMPGMLPTINEECVKQVVKTGLGINAKINLKSIFDRKNYFYPDLPQGYQISQYLDPIVGEGEVEIELEDGGRKVIRVERIHLEQDAGKSIHDQHPTMSLIDLNRSGVALMEIVSKPDMNSPAEAAEYVKTIRSIVRALGTSDGDMEKGNLRCDANVSVRKIGETKLGTRCEIKNLNSMRNIARAIEFEAARQVEILENGGKIDQETRLFDALTGETRVMRSKEDAMDYRYFPDPDLPPLVLSQEFVDEIKKSLPELPQARKERYMRDLGLTEYDAGVLTADEEISAYFEQLIQKHDPRLCVTWLTVELFGRMNKLGINFENLRTSSKSFTPSRDSLAKSASDKLFPDNCISEKKFSSQLGQENSRSGAKDSEQVLKVPAANLIGLLDLIKSGEISGKIAKDVLDVMVESGKTAAQIVEAKGLKQVSDSGAIEKIIKEVIAANAAQFEKYLAGDEKLHGFFVGQVMKASKGQANPGMVNELLRTYAKAASYS
ncbi:MAG: Asp-tRNA(Asn)/Glu-tRNA(Gln) amidotransferase subunit GatB [Alphaproteobacteria bacterium]|nr:Asp-tRNA(Asn)/Glu-tRNA(Gln) amidotransferase subunit GatB [Alphaproteobacteria bacterium]